MERMISAPAPNMTMLREAAWVCTDIKVEGNRWKGIVAWFPASGLGFSNRKGLMFDRDVDVDFKRQVIDSIEWRDYLVEGESFESEDA